MIQKFRSDRRGASFNVGYTITVGITAILIIGLISGVGTVMQDQQDRAVGHQVNVIGDQVASGVMATERLGSSGTETNASVTRDLPTEVVGTPYQVRLVEDGPSGDPAVVVEAQGESYVSETTVSVDSEVEESVVTGGATMEIVHEVDPQTGEATLFIQEKES